jgi:hypothetical protein
VRLRKFETAIDKTLAAIKKLAETRGAMTRTATTVEGIRRRGRCRQ